MERNKAIALKLAELRKKADMTQVEVAYKCGISQSTYGMYEIGQRMPSDEIKIKLAELFGQTVQAIFFNQDATLSGN